MLNLSKENTKDRVIGQSKTGRSKAGRLEVRTDEQLLLTYRMTGDEVS